MAKKICTNITLICEKKVASEKVDNCVPLADSFPQANVTNFPIESRGTDEENDESLLNIFKDSTFRLCEICNKTRILDFRAANKYPLGCYRYGGKLEKVRFDCSRLVDTACDVPEDIVMGEVSEDLNLLVHKTETVSPPSSGILIKKGDIIEKPVERR